MTTWIVGARDQVADVLSKLVRGFDVDFDSIDMMLATKAKQRSRRCTVIPFFHCGDPFNLPRPCVGVSTTPGVFLKFPPIFVSCPVGRPRGREVGRELLSRKATGKGLIQLSRFSPFLLHLLGRRGQGVFPRSSS